MEQFGLSEYQAAVEAVRGPQGSVDVMLAEYRKRRDFVIERLRQIPGVKIGVPKGAFYGVPVGPVELVQRPAVECGELFVH